MSVDISTASPVSANTSADALHVATILEAVCDAVPDSPAFTLGDTTLTFRELDEHGNRMGHVLADAGVGPGDRVALHMRNSVEHFDAFLGAVKLRAIPININYRYTGTELSYLYANSESAAVVVDAEFSGLVAEILAQAPTVRVVLVVRGAADPALVAECDRLGVRLVDVAAELADASAERDFGPRSPDDHFILYTGGTTGYPKGVIWRSEDYYYAALSGGNPYGPDKRHSPAEVAEHSVNGGFFKVLLSAPLIHGAGTFTLLTFLLLGGHVILMPEFDAVDIARAIDREKPMSLVFVGDGMGTPIADTMYEMRDELDFSSLMAVASGGGIWSGTARAKLLAVKPDLILRDSFGASESGSDGEVRHDAQGRLLLDGGAHVGVVDENLDPIEPGSEDIGYLARMGRIPLGYLGDPDKTAQTFPTKNGVRMSILGDMAQVLEDGTIVVLGRGSQCINTGGEKVFPEEVEQALKAHPAVYDALVAAAPDERFGQKVAAVVSIREGHEVPSLEDVQAACRKTIAGYKVPRALVIVDEVRRSPSGKADYRWAKEQVEVV